VSPWSKPTHQVPVVLLLVVLVKPLPVHVHAMHTLMGLLLSEQPTAPHSYASTAPGAQRLLALPTGLLDRGRAAKAPKAQLQETSLVPARSAAKRKVAHSLTFDLLV
jgi:uncharacterized protein (DUF2384 family)